ncbi:MAG: hypothetical protein COU65_00385 [Candidatus Pacebacteria bacterium CG10_big_fil_rev_8_21_14_0_10_42_12]|nr:MAG: hypothetical protein COU65_00385 [Candidatus Pacebacteria bacterium CG10_big_fil_rev_8_21_14_0_10_42_12]
MPRTNISYKNTIYGYKKAIFKTSAVSFKRAESQLQKRPITSLLILLALLLGLLVISSRLKTPDVIEKPEEPIYTVETFSIGEAPSISAQARVEKTGIIVISAQTSGVVSKVRVSPGQKVSAYKQVVSLASTYNGSNIPALQTQVSKKQYDSVVQTYDAQKSLIDSQKQIAEKTDANSDQLRDISNQSISETEALISLNESIIETLDNTISTSTSSSDVEAAKKTKSTYASATNALRQSLRSTRYQVDGENPPANLSNLQKDVLIKQLDLQQKALDLNKDISELQYKLARAQESLMYPTTPFSGVIERVFVREGQQVKPGDKLATLFCDIKETQLVATLPAGSASQVSMLEPSLVFLDGKKIELFPEYISQIATDGQLRTIIYSLPQEYSELVTEKGLIKIEIPLGSSDTSSSMPFIPLSAVHQNEISTEVFVAEDGYARSKVISIGEVQGNYVAVKSGLSEGDQIILDRTVVADVRIKTE